MNNEENNNRPPRRGPGHGPGAVEKPKDFKGTTKKLLKNYLAKSFPKAQWIEIPVLPNI